MRKIPFSRALIKIWFSGGVSRNIAHVKEIERDKDVLFIRTDTTVYIVNFNNVSLIEEIHTDDV